MTTLVEAIEPICQVLPRLNRYDEDGIDRLNHKYSPIIFCILAVFVTTAQYVGETIKCWTPAQFTGQWTDYANSICWISNTYYVPLSQYDIVKASRKEIVYYQWVPAALALQALAFYVPYVYWRILSSSIGINLNKIGVILRQQDHVLPDNRDSSVAYISIHINRALGYTRELRRGCCATVKNAMVQCGCFCGKRYGNFLIVMYITTKLLYLASVLTQLYLLNYFLGTDYSFYGFEVLRDLATSGDYKESRKFPRVTLCDFEVRSIAKHIPYTVQCTLPINIFNEKIFIFIWFWLALMVLLNVCSILHWLWIIFAANRRQYVKTYISMIPNSKRYKRSDDRRKLYEFCNKYLRQDGHFILRMIGKNTSDVMVAELVALLWSEFTPTSKEQEV